MSIAGEVYENLKQDSGKVTDVLDINGTNYSMNRKLSTTGEILDWINTGIKGEEYITKFGLIGIIVGSIVVVCAWIGVG
jgi:hypothetical protein